MKPKKLALFFAFFAVSSLVLGQDYAFKVLASKGSNQVKTGDSWEPIRIGASLKEADELKLAENGYLGLIHVSGKPKEIKVAGVYEVSKLSSEMGGGSTSVVQKYTDFILSSNAEAKVNRLSATGAVHRGEAADISVLLPEANAKVFNDEVVISWQVNGAVGPYVVTFKNMFDDVLQTIETPETMVKVDLNDPKLAKEQTIIVTVTSKENPEPNPTTHAITRLTKAEHDRIQTSLNEIQGDLGEPTAMGDVILAQFYENNNLLIDALSAYQKANKLQPDAFQESYDEFLVRQGLKEQK